MDLRVNMRKRKTLFMVSNFLKIFFILITSFILLLIVLGIKGIILRDGIFVIIILLFFLLIIIDYYIFSVRFLIDYKEKKIYYYSFIRKTIFFDLINKIIITDEYSFDPRKFINIVFELYGDKKILFGQYASFSKKRSWKRSQEIIDILNEAIKGKLTDKGMNKGNG